jgi:hypothetical protein
MTRDRRGRAVVGYLYLWAGQREQIDSRRGGREIRGKTRGRSEGHQTRELKRFDHG